MFEVCQSLDKGKVFEFPNLERCLSDVSLLVVLGKGLFENSGFE